MSSNGNGGARAPHKQYEDMGGPPPDVMDRDVTGFAELMPPAGNLQTAQGGAVIVAQGREVTARKVAVPRDLVRILRDIKPYCASFGDTYVYSWEANDRANNRKVLIEGGTIKLANMLVQVFGNCATDCDIMETPTHWLFKAWFIDYERGTATARMFQQRKNQNTGMKDADRQADIVFQIGQSKALRNVVLNALSDLASFAIEEAKKGMIDKFSNEENKRKAWAFIESVMDRHGITMKRVEAVVGRVENEWTVQNLCKVYTEMRGIHDGFTVADEVYPDDKAADEVMRKKGAAKLDGLAGDKGKDPAKEPERSNPDPADAKQSGEGPAQADTAAAAKSDAKKPAPKKKAAPPPEPEPETDDADSLFGNDD